MSSRNWPAFAVLGGLIVSFVCAYPGVGKPSSEGPHSTAEEEQTGAPSPVPNVVHAPKGDESGCDGAKAHEDAATCYSRRSAEATERQADEARASTKLDFVQAGGLLLSLVFTGWAAISAARATRVAQEAAVDAEKSLAISMKSADASARAAEAAHRYAEGVEKQLSVVERAYVFGTVDTSPIGDPPSPSISLSVTIKNHGKTPARVKTIKIGLFPIISGGVGVIPTKPDYSKAGLAEMDTIFSSGEGGSILTLENKPLNGIVYAEIIYDDIFRIQHFSRFLFEYDAVNRTMQIVGDPEWNDFD
jgi:hypothetical protein